MNQLFNTLKYLFDISNNYFGILINFHVFSKFDFLHERFSKLFWINFSVFQIFSRNWRCFSKRFLWFFESEFFRYFEQIFSIFWLIFLIFLQNEKCFHFNVFHFQTKFLKFHVSTKFDFCQQFSYLLNQLLSILNFL